jgi:hypothetical protein
MRFCFFSIYCSSVRFAAVGDYCCRPKSCNRGWWPDEHGSTLKACEPWQIDYKKNYLNIFSFSFIIKIHRSSAAPTPNNLYIYPREPRGVMNHQLMVTSLLVCHTGQIQVIRH